MTTTGKIKKPLITVAGTMDALLPIQHQARAYEHAVDASRKGNNDKRNAQYRLYEVQNGNHIESYVTPFPELVVIQPHAQKAFDLLVDACREECAAAAQPMHSGRRRNREPSARTRQLRAVACAVSRRSRNCLR